MVPTRTTPPFVNNIYCALDANSVRVCARSRAWTGQPSVTPPSSPRKRLVLLDPRQVTLDAWLTLIPIGGV